MKLCCRQARIHESRIAAKKSLRLTKNKMCASLQLSRTRNSTVDLRGDCLHTRLALANVLGSTVSGDDCACVEDSVGISCPSQRAALFRCLRKPQIPPVSIIHGHGSAVTVVPAPPVTPAHHIAPTTCHPHGSARVLQPRLYCRLGFWALGEPP